MPKEGKHSKCSRINIMHSRKNNSPIGELGSKQKRDKDGGIKKTLSFVSQGYIQHPEHLM